jgi:predicted nucleic acid-binding Zn ribbon protein
LQSPAHAGSSLADSSTLKMEMIRSSETSVHTRSTQRHIPEDDILHSHRCEILKSHMEAIRPSEMSVNPRSTQRHIPEDDILHSHRCENFKSYIRRRYSSRTSSITLISLRHSILCLSQTGFHKLPRNKFRSL